MNRRNTLNERTEKVSLQELYLLHRVRQLKKQDMIYFIFDLQTYQIIPCSSINLIRREEAIKNGRVQKKLDYSWRYDNPRKR